MKKKIIFIQNDLTSCGACSIESVVSYYGGYVPHETVVEDTLTSRNGTSAYHIVKALEKYGFHAYGINRSLNDIDKSYLPLIAHTSENGYEHFLVIYDVDDKNVLTMDPKCGMKKYRREEFNSIFDEYLIVCKPNGPICKYEYKSTLKDVLKGIKNYKGVLRPLFIISILIMVLSGGTSLYVQIASSTDNILQITLFIALTIVLKFILSYIKVILESKLSINFGKYLHNFFINHIFKLPISYLANKRVGEITKKIGDVNYIKEWFLDVIFTGGLNFIIWIFFFIISASLSIKLSLIGLLGFIIYFLISLYSAKKLYNLEKISLDNYNEYIGDLTEYMAGSESIKSLNKENYFKSKIDKTYFEFQKRNYSLIKTSTIFSCSKDFILEMAILLTLMYGLLDINSGHMTLIVLFTFSSVYSIMCSAFSNIVSLIPDYIHIKTIFRNISEFLDAKEESRSSLSFNDFSLIRFKDVSFSYDNYRDIFTGLSLQLKKGDKVLVTGASGCGKSTFAKCLCGYLRNYTGSIYIDDAKINKMDIFNLRNNVVYVGQNERLFSGTLRENVTFDKYNQSDFNDAIEHSMLKDVIDKKFTSADFYLQDGGLNMSGGERARVILARALYKKPKVLILDETLSNISSEDEDKILDGLLSVKGLTLIYITHRDKSSLFERKIQFEKGEIKCYRMKKCSK